MGTTTSGVIRPPGMADGMDALSGTDHRSRYPTSSMADTPDHTQAVVPQAQ